MTYHDELSPVVDVMNDVGVWWAVAGGWAIDLWVGEMSRRHHDVEVVVRRCDQPAVHAALADRWALFCLDPPGGDWRAWNGVPVEPPAFQLRARSPDGEFDIFTEQVDATSWQFRRDGRITRPVSELIVHSHDGIPLVRPEVQLLYMAKAMHAKNVHDFELARPSLDHAAASWLAGALAVTLPGHPWIKPLT